MVTPSVYVSLQALGSAMAGRDARLCALSVESAR